MHDRISKSREKEREQESNRQNETRIKGRGGNSVSEGKEQHGSLGKGVRIMCRIWLVSFRYITLFVKNCLASYISEEVSRIKMG